MAQKVSLESSVHFTIEGNYLNLGFNAQSQKGSGMSIADSSYANLFYNQKMNDSNSQLNSKQQVLH